MNAARFSLFGWFVEVDFEIQTWGVGIHAHFSLEEPGFIVVFGPFLLQVGREL